VDTHIVTGSTPALRNLHRTVNQSNISVHGQTVVALAAARAVLKKHDREAGVVVIDIGGSTTNLAIFDEGEVLHTATIPVGSNHITNDLAIGLKTDLDTAETIKLEHVRAVAAKGKSSDIITIKQADKTELEFKQSEVNMIAEARLSELFELINKELKKVDRLAKLPAGAVLTGGGAKLVGIVEYAKVALQLPVRIGKPSGFTGIVDNIDGPQFSAAVGLMLEDMLSQGSERDWHLNLGRTSQGILQFLRRFRP